MKNLLLVLSLFALSAVGSEIHDAVLTNNQARVKELLKADPKLISAKDDFEATPLHFAQTAEMADFLLKNGAELNAKTETGETVLHRAANANTLMQKDFANFDAPAPPERKPGEALALVKFLIAKGCDPNQKSGSGATPLFRVEYGEVAKFLIEKGAKVDVRNTGGSTPLHWSAMSGPKPSGVEVLIANGADVNAVDDQGRTPLHSAVGDVPFMDLLLKKGAKANCVDNEGQAPLHYSVYQNDEESVAFLIKSGAELNAADKKGDTPLHLALHSGAVVDLLVQKGANISAKNKKGKTPLHLAVVEDFGDKSESLDALLRNGADVNATDASHWTPLYYATAPEAIEALIAHKADVNALDKSGSTPLHYVMSDEQAETLLKHGARLNAQSTSGHTPLMAAISHIGKARAELERAKIGPDAEAEVEDEKMSRIRAHLSVLKFLIKSGADLKLTIREGDTALHLAAYVGNVEIVKALIAAGAPLDLEDVQGATPLGLTIDAECVRALIGAGADVKHHGKGGTPLHMAARAGSADTAKLLLDAGANVNAILESKTTKLTPLDAARFTPRNGAMEKLLRAHGGKTFEELNAAKNEKDQKQP